MTKAEYKTLKSGDGVCHRATPNTVEMIEGAETAHGFFIREKGSKGGWNTINERNCQYYTKAMEIKL